MAAANAIKSKAKHEETVAEMIRRIEAMSSEHGRLSRELAASEGRRVAKAPPPKVARREDFVSPSPGGLRAAMSDSDDSLVSLGRFPRTLFNELKDAMQQRRARASPQQRAQHGMPDDHGPQVAATNIADLEQKLRGMQYAAGRDAALIHDLDRLSKALTDERDGLVATNMVLQVKYSKLEAEVSARSLVPEPKPMPMPPPPSPEPAANDERLAAQEAKADALDEQAEGMKIAMDRVDELSQGLAAAQAKALDQGREADEKLEETERAISALRAEVNGTKVASNRLLEDRDEIIAGLTRRKEAADRLCAQTEAEAERLREALRVQTEKTNAAEAVVSQRQEEEHSRLVGYRAELLMAEATVTESASETVRAAREDSEQQVAQARQEAAAAALRATASKAVVAEAEAEAEAAGSLAESVRRALRAAMTAHAHSELILVARAAAAEDRLAAVHDRVFDSENAATTARAALEAATGENADLVAALAAALTKAAEQEREFKAVVSSRDNAVGDARADAEKRAADAEAQSADAARRSELAAAAEVSAAAQRSAAQRLADERAAQLDRQRDELDGTRRVVDRLRAEITNAAAEADAAAYRANHALDEQREVATAARKLADERLAATDSAERRAAESLQEAGGLRERRAFFEAVWDTKGGFAAACAPLTPPPPPPPQLCSCAALPAASGRARPPRTPGRPSGPLRTPSTKRAGTWRPRSRPKAESPTSRRRSAR